MAKKPAPDFGSISLAFILGLGFEFKDQNPGSDLYISSSFKFGPGLGPYIARLGPGFKKKKLNIRP